MFDFFLLTIQNILNFLLLHTTDFDPLLLGFLFSFLCIIHFIELVYKINLLLNFNFNFDLLINSHFPSHLYLSPNSNFHSNILQLADKNFFDLFKNYFPNSQKNYLTLTNQISFKVLLIFVIINPDPNLNSFCLFSILLILIFSSKKKLFFFSFLIIIFTK
jgi:hypothetical protein